MKLRSVRIQEFRCIEDSEEFSVSDVTCLVGKNESGKTAILKALAKLNPVDGYEAKFTELDYPRRKWIPGQPLPNDPPALTTKWHVDDGDLAELEAQFAVGVMANREIVVTKSYDNLLRFNAGVDESPVVRRLLHEANLSEQDAAAIADAPLTVDALRVALEAVSEPTERHSQLQARINALYPSGVRASIEDALRKLLPQFVYFDQYRTLPGQVSLNDYVARNQGGNPQPGDQVFAALLELAGTTADQLRNIDQFEPLSAALQAVSNNITGQVFEYWTQNEYLEARLRLDAAKSGDPAPFNNGFVFRTRIYNNRHKSETSFDERSTGFVWFFSFLVWFSRLKDRLGQRLIVLLDEPGLTLHARAQGDLLRYINEKLRPGYQVLYTTHSPFMVDPDHLLSARTVEDATEKGKVLGTKVGDKVLSIDPDTISPLQRALDYEITQTLFVGRNTLLVEGPSDLVYLKWFSNQIDGAASKLDYRWVICHVGGVDRIPGFVSLFRGNALNIVALVDFASGQKQKAELAAKTLPEGHLLRADAFAGQAEADTEDILGREFYVALVNAAYDLPPSLRVPVARPVDAPMRVVKEVETHFRTLPPSMAEFDHFSPARWLFEHETAGKALPGIGDAVQRMTRLIAAINPLRE